MRLILLFMGLHYMIRDSEGIYEEHENIVQHI